MEDDSIVRAHRVYKSLCETLDSLKMHYEKNEEDLSIDCGVQGEDIPMDLTIFVNTDLQIITLLSHLPFMIPEDKRVEMAIATSIVNNRLPDGSFDYDISKGLMFFRMTNSFLESDIGNELFSYMLMISCKIIDDFNDKFLMLSKGIMSVEDFTKLFKR